VSEEIVEPPLEVFVIPDVYSTQAGLGEDVIQGLVTSGTLDEGANATKGFEDMFLFGWVVNEGLKRSSLVNVSGSIKRLVDPL
jgi:hypothetical protein